MKKIFFALLLLSPAAFSEDFYYRGEMAPISYVPTPFAAYVSSNGTGAAGTWNPLTGSGGTPISYVPTGYGMYYSTDGSGAAGTWAPWTGTSTSGNATTINGAAVPASATILGSNSSSQLITQTLTNVNNFLAGGSSFTGFRYANNASADTLATQNQLSNLLGGGTTFSGLRMANGLTQDTQALSSDVITTLGYTPVNPASAAITGGTINGTTLGLTTAASGYFTLWGSQGDTGATPPVLDYITSTNASGTITTPANHALSTSGIPNGWACSIYRIFSSGSNYTSTGICNASDAGMRFVASNPAAKGSESFLTTATLLGTGVFQPNAVAPNVETVSFSATPTFSSTRGMSRITLTANVTSSTLPIGTDDVEHCFDIIQNATGGFTFVWPTNVHGGMTIGTNASSHNLQCFRANTSTGNYYPTSTGVTNIAP